MPTTDLRAFVQNGPGAYMTVEFGVNLHYVRNLRAVLSFFMKRVYIYDY